MQQHNSATIVPLAAELKNVFLRLEVHRAIAVPVDRMRQANGDAIYSAWSSHCGTYPDDPPSRLIQLYHYHHHEDPKQHTIIE